MDKLALIPLNNIAITDAFWNKYVELVKDSIIPYQWDILNDKHEGVRMSHCINNFKIAAGRISGEFNGVIFVDSDLMKWIEAVAFSLTTHPDKELEKTVDDVIDLIGEAQLDDGYLNTYYIINGLEKRFSNLRDGHELYCAGHLMEAAVAYYKATGKDKLLHIAQRFADLICDEFSEEKNSKGYPGHQEVEIGLIKLYEVTGQTRYLKQAKLFIDRRGEEPNYFAEEMKGQRFKQLFDEFSDYDPIYSQAHLPVRKQTTAEGHAVRAVYMYCAMADIAAMYDDAELLNACERLWNNIAYQRMYITGSIGSSGILERFTTDYDLPNNCNYSETCASIGLALFSRRMAQITGESKYYDVVERALYNTVLAGIAMDGKSFFYVNPLEVWPDNCIPRTSKEHVKPVRQKWFGVACCPPNIARTLASLGEYIYMNKGNNIWVNLFISNKTHIDVNGQRVNIDVQTNFPYDGYIRIALDCEKALAGKLYIRIPDYVKKYKLHIDGKILDDINVEKGYCILELDFANKVIELEYDLQPCFVRANPNVREDIGKVAVMKGPLVYCMEEVDNEPNLPAYFVNSSLPLYEYYDANLLGGTTVIKCDGKKVKQDKWNEDTLYSEKNIEYEDKTLTLIPYPYWGNRKHGEMLVWIKEYM
ncbi:MAG TPA: glycoside hydrolase family 127 protein [Clostridiales bacterium]|nr:glycoside hydrolase family 127 protein [Clostridiales bacterium]